MGAGLAVLALVAWAGVVWWQRRGRERRGGGRAGVRSAPERVKDVFSVARLLEPAATRSANEPVAEP